MMFGWMDGSLPQEADSLLQAISWTASEKYIGLIGAGGKTTLLYLLAEELRRLQLRVLVTTSTKIYEPKNYKVFLEGEALPSWESGEILVAGRRIEGGKLTALSEPLREKLFSMADMVLVEADGAKKHALKLPAAHEPVLWREMQLVLSVLSLEGLEKPILESCHRSREVAAFLGKHEEEKAGLEDMARLFSASCGGKDHADMRKVFVCNQVKKENIGEIMPLSKMLPHRVAFVGKRM